MPKNKPHPLLFLATVLFYGPPAGSEETAPRPNIMLVFADDLGYGDVGCYGAVRSGRWKLHLPHAYRSLPNGGGHGGTPSKYERRQIDRSLFDIEADPGESSNVAATHPDIVERLEALAERARDDLGDTATHRNGKNVRPAGQLRDTAAGDERRQ